MTALHAVGGGLPLALHIPHVVEQVGSLAGFAAVIGLAVLSALYFSQARDLRRLREWAGRAPERAAEMAAAQPSPVPGRVVATPQRPPQQAAAATPAAAPAGQQQQKQEGEQQAAAANGDSAPSVTAAPGQKPADAGGDKAGDAAEAKPGMPAPASAAAAAASAGAGAASVAGPKAPGAAPAPPAPGGAPAAPAPAGTPNGPGGAQGGSGGAPAAGPNAPGATPAGAGAAPRPSPQRPPGSVLPPRTGTLPPVRRLPSSNVGAAGQTGVLAQPPQQERGKRNPLYVALAVIGVLVVGAAAAVGVPALVNGSKSNNSKTASSTHAASKKRHKAAVNPANITVAVLNGTSITGLAQTLGDRVEADGFRKGTISNASVTNGQRANSVVMYTPGHNADAQLVAKRLSINNVEPADASSRQIAGDATVIVIVGTDKSS